jgi:protein-S-isoprenylcysteine O-methyltransferase Ste14
MKRFAALLYGIVCYVVFLGAFLYAIWFVWTMDAAQSNVSLTRALAMDTLLLSLFAIQHSGMARQGFKRAWTRFIPKPIERSTYVLTASLVLVALVYFWQPLPGVLWEVRTSWLRLLLEGLFWVGWLQILVSTWLIDHFELFGIKQVRGYWRNESYEPPAFKTPGPYKFVRHPLYLGFLIAFWSTPRMTFGHLYFSIMCTAYILLAIQFEERDLVRFYGEAYQAYRNGVSMLVPWPGKKKQS